MMVVFWTGAVPKVERFNEWARVMEFIELSGQQLLRVITKDELDADALRSAGVSPESVVRVNRQGDIELRMAGGWEIIGGLLGDYAERVTRETGLHFA